MPLWSHAPRCRVATCLLGCHHMQLCAWPFEKPQLLQVHGVRLRMRRTRVGGGEPLLLREHEVVMRMELSSGWQDLVRSLLHVKRR